VLITSNPMHGYRKALAKFSGLAGLVLGFMAATRQRRLRLGL